MCFVFDRADTFRCLDRRDALINFKGKSICYYSKTVPNGLSKIIQGRMIEELFVRPVKFMLRQSKKFALNA